MHCEDLLVDDGRDWQAVEAIRKSLPKLNVVPSLAFIVEAVDTVDRRTLVIASQNKEILRVFDLVGEEQADRFKRLLASVHIIA